MKWQQQHVWAWVRGGLHVNSRLDGGEDFLEELGGDGIVAVADRPLNQGIELFNILHIQTLYEKWKIVFEGIK